MTVLLLRENPDTLTAADRATIATLAPDMQLVVTDDPAQIEPVLPEVKIAAGHMTPALLPACPTCAGISSGRGRRLADAPPRDRPRDFVITNASGVHAIQISEHILALLLAFARRAAGHASQMRGDGNEERQDIFELAGKTLLLIGVGAIGERTAGGRGAGRARDGRAARSDRAGAGLERIIGPERLAELLPQADFVVLTVPLTPETRH